MQQRKKQAKTGHKLEYGLFMFLIMIVKLTPLFLVKMNKRILCFLFQVLARRYSRLVKKNLEIAFPQASEGDILRLKDKVYRHFSGIIIDLIYMYVKKRPGRILRKIEIKHLENLEKTLGKKQGVIIFTAHFGNWELVPYILSRTLEKEGSAAHLSLYNNEPGTGKNSRDDKNIRPGDIHLQPVKRKIFGIAREMDNPLVESLVKRFREFMGLEVIYKDNSIRTVLKTLENNGIVYFLIDQNAIAREAVSIDFFGRKVSAVTSVSRLHLKAGVPLVPLFLHYEKDKIVLDIREAIRFAKSGNSRDDAANLTRQCNALIEEEIRKYPEQWFWFHNRWKI
ncbi:MAG: lysophospholipid acyltransferase family protein [Candidatus Aminicenantes bacterium]|nr:lysophospholipid acyltransferase family protein [Candidatus Aminicenantes bacterium]